MERVLSIAGEGESLTVYRTLNENPTIFIVKYWSMFDDDEDMVIPDNTFDSFEKAFADIKKRRSWYKLVSDIHIDYRDMVEKEIENLKILNEK
jgi:hypothetical protein